MRPIRTTLLLGLALAVTPLAAEVRQTRGLAAAVGDVGAGTAAVAAANDADSGSDLIGQPAPEWAFTRWVRGSRTTLAELRGKVVLVRWWTDGCHFCRSTLPALETLTGRLDRSDLVVLGVYHPKPPREVSDRRILKNAGALGFSGPIAFDRDWRTLGRYWLDGHDERNWTSVSFLIDRRGVIRWLHGGGEYHPGRAPGHERCDLEFAQLEAALATLLAE